MRGKKGPTIPTCSLQCAMIERAVHAYAQDHAGRPPSTLDDLIVVRANGERYLSVQRMPLDPWKREYRYEALPTPRVWSAGPDGIDGSEDDVHAADARVLDNAR